MFDRAARAAWRVGAAPYVDIAVLTGLATLLQDVTSVSGAPSQLRDSSAAFGLYGAFFVKGASRDFGRPLHSILLFDLRREHSSVPTAIFPSPSRAAAVKDGASSAPPKGLSLRAASTAAGCRRSGGWPRDDPRGACHWPRSIARTTLV